MKTHPSGAFENDCQADWRPSLLHKFTVTYEPGTLPLPKRTGICLLWSHRFDLPFYSEQHFVFILRIVDNNTLSYKKAGTKKKEYAAWAASASLYYCHCASGKTFSEEETYTTVPLDWTSGGGSTLSRWEAAFFWNNPRRLVTSLFMLLHKSPSFAGIWSIGAPFLPHKLSLSILKQTYRFVIYLTLNHALALVLRILSREKSNRIGALQALINWEIMTLPSPEELSLTRDQTIVRSSLLLTGLPSCPQADPYGSSFQTELPIPWGKSNLLST